MAYTEQSHNRATDCYATLCLPANNFYTHNFRIEAATTAAKAGLPPWLIKVLGRWSSDCYKRYIRTPKCTILEVPRLLANTSL